MAGELFNSLMLNAVDEIIRRDPEYLSKQPVRTGRAAPNGSSRTQKQFAGAQVCRTMRGIPAAGQHSI